MSAQILQVLSTGLGASLQDRGRTGWRRFGVPPSGVMDDHAAAWANRLLENPPQAPVLELLLQGARLAALRPVWIATTGAEAGGTVASWRALRVEAGSIIEFPHNHTGVWSYLAVENGFEAARQLGSASAYPRGRLGRALASGDVLSRAAGRRFDLPAGVLGRVVVWSERRDYSKPPALRVWPGPQHDSFNESDRAAFFEQEWTVSAQSDRVGYRLTGPRLASTPAEIISEPVLAGSVQVPGNGQPIVTMRDGPTVGGYPKLGLIDPADLSWLAQCRPGQKVRFVSAQGFALPRPGA